MERQVPGAGVIGPRALESTTDIATLQESGVANYAVVSWNALLAPAGTPPEIVNKLNAALQEILADADVKKRLIELGIEARASTPQENFSPGQIRHRQVAERDREGRNSKAVAALLRGFAHRRDFKLLVDRRGRMGGIQQLLLAQTDSLQAFWRNLEGGHERAADRVGSFLA
jgi:hypothetical protein